MERSESFAPQESWAKNHISVDCVVIGFDGEQLKVLLVERTGKENGQPFRDRKLPGSLIRTDEDLDQAAHRVLFELTGLKQVRLAQFKAFGSKDRTNDPKDVRWLEETVGEKIDRIVTVAYWAMVKVARATDKHASARGVCWVGLKEVGDLAFDHNRIIREAMVSIRRLATFNPSMLFDLLPRKFTAAQLRVLFERIYDKPIDPRNFHKKIARMEYVVPLDEQQRGVTHRAARYYRFDRQTYNRTRR